MRSLTRLVTVFGVLLPACIAAPAGLLGQEIVIDGKPVQGSARIEITTERAAKSPTGREPRILWSPQWQARWQRARDENHPWYQWLQLAVENPASAYFDKYLFPTILYQISGDTVHARQAWAALEPRLDPQRALSQDVIRANWLKWLVCYEWLYPALTDAQRAVLAAHLDRCAQAVALTPLADSDRLVTAWFGLSIWSALGPPYGGETAKAICQSERFAAMGQRLIEYARQSAGGEWVEGTYYNAGTTTTLMLGLACSDRIYPVEEDPMNGVTTNLRALAPQFAAAELHRWDNTLAHRLSWGAIQVANFPRTGIKRGDLALDLWAALGLDDLVGRAQAKGGYWARPHGVFYLFAEVRSQKSEVGSQKSGRASPPQADLTSDPLTSDSLVCPLTSDLWLACPGQQLMYARSSWQDPDAAVVLFRCGRFNAAHHPTFDGGHFEMLRRGEWVLSRPRAYSDSGNVDGLGANNSLLLGNQPINFVRREMVGASSPPLPPSPAPPFPSYWMVQEHGGPWQHGQRAIEYVHSAKRWLVWLPGQWSVVSGQWSADVLLVRDVIAIDQPPDQRADKKAYNIGKAAERHAAYIEGAMGGGGDEARIPLVQWILHAPVAPTASGLQPQAYSWTTAGGQTVRVTTLAPGPDSVAVRLVDEAEHYAGVDPRELGWQIRVSPVGFEGGQVELLHAVVVAATPPQADARDWPSFTPDGAGVLVARAGQPDLRVSFSEKAVEVR